MCDQLYEASTYPDVVILLFILYSNPFSAMLVADRANGKNQVNFNEALYSQHFSMLNTFDISTTCEQISFL